MNIFVLTTGRSGSLTFAKACSHLTNYTAGHETRAHLLPPERLEYPDNHIEVDNRLSERLGQLGEAYDGRAFYAHLIRDEADTAASFVRHSIPTKERPVPYPANMLRAHCHGVVMRPTPWPDYHEPALDHVRRVNANIRMFLEWYQMCGGGYVTVRLGNDEDFRHFLSTIRAEGNLDAAMAEWRVRHNRSEP